MAVWIVDDGSTDGTSETAKRSASNLDLRILWHDQNKGLGRALLTGIQNVCAVADFDDVAVVMDADDTHDPEIIPRMALAIDAGEDIVIMSRFVNGGDDSSAPPFRRLLSRGAGFLLRTFGPYEDVHDFSSGYRAYRVSILRQALLGYSDQLIQEAGFACMVELLLKLSVFSPRVREVPLYLRYDRKCGPSKLRIFRTVLQYLQLIIRYRTDERFLRQPRELEG